MICFTVYLNQLDKHLKNTLFWNRMAYFKKSVEVAKSKRKKTGQNVDKKLFGN